MDTQKVAEELVDIASSLKTAASKGYWHYEKGQVAGGMILVLDGAPSAMATKFGIKNNDWELTKIGTKLWGAYDGERVTLFTNPGDFVPMDW